MRAFLGDLAVIENDDLVRADNGGETVRDHDDGASFCERFQRLLDQRFIFGVGKRRRLVQHDDRRIFQNRTSQRHALLFAARKIRSLRADDCVDTVRQFFYNIVALRRVKRRLGFFAGCVRARGAHVFKDRRFEKAGVLENERHFIHQHMRVDLFYVHAADKHFTGRCVPETRDQTCRRGLAAARRADQRDGLPGLDLEGNVIERGMVRAVVGKGDVFEFHAVVLRLLR